MADVPEKSPIQNAYAQRFTDHLVVIRKEQEDVTGQIADLQKRLEQLRVDEAWLIRAQSSLPAVLAPSEPEAEPAAEAAKVVIDAAQAVPQPRQGQSAKAAQRKLPAKKATAKGETTAKKATAKKTTTNKSAAKKSAAKQAPAPKGIAAEASAQKAAAEEKSGPPLWELILGILLKTPGQPCVASEVTDQLAQDHPGRATSVQTVRNNLESLAKKDLVEKSRRQRNVMYTAYANASAAPAADKLPVGEGEEALEAADEKVPAEV